MKLRTSAGFFVLLVALAAFSTEAQAGNSLFEDFTTAVHKDTTHTTADWNVAAGELRLYSFTPTLAGSLDTAGWGWDLEVHGDYVVSADGGDGITVIDISDPTAPDSIGNYDTPDNAVDVRVYGDHAFVADRTGGLQIIDISNPAIPTFAGAYDTSSSAQCVVVSGDYAYVAWDLQGLKVIDISDPTAPFLAGAYDTTGIAWAVRVAGDHAFVADGNMGLLVVDISDPTNPTLQGLVVTDRALDVWVAGDHAYVADANSGLQVVDISDPANPTIVGSVDTPGYAQGIYVEGDCAYLADGSSGLVVIDISDPTDPVLLHTTLTSGPAKGVVVSGEYAYLAASAPGLLVVKINESVLPTAVGGCNTRSSAYDVCVDGDYAYVADLDSGLTVIDIHDPTMPVLVGGYGAPGASHGLAIAGVHAYVADQLSGLHVVDISDPTIPTLAGFVGAPGAVAVAVSGNHALVAAGTSGLAVVDISDPTTPTIVGSHDTPGSAEDVSIAGDRAYVADASMGLRIVDISDPTTPVFLGAYDTPGSATGVAVAGDHAFVADLTSGLLVIDISNPSAPLLAGSLDTPGEATDVFVSGNTAYVTDRELGLQAIDIADPANPVGRGSFDTPGHSWGVHVSGNYAYVADGLGQRLEVVQVRQTEFRTEDNQGRSLSTDTVVPAIWARIATSQMHTVTWEVSADGGTNWQAILPDGAWNAISDPGSGLLWRTTHAWASPGVNPAVSQLQIDWLAEAGIINAVTDTPNDQGRQVRVEWVRSGHDFPSDPAPILQYAVYRKIDTGLAPTHRLLSMEPGVPASRALAVHIESAAAAGWDFLTSVPARAEDGYAVVVPTLADSTIAGGAYNTTFMVSALTAIPSVFYDSQPDSGYSLDNLAPGVPQSFLASFSGGNVDLIWDPAPEPDFQYFRIYRDTDPGFVPGPGNLVHETAASTWQDSPPDPGSVFYKITALDFSGNEGDPAGSGSVTDVGPPLVPTDFRLRPAAPNPFRTTTRIAFDLPAETEIRLDVFAVTGRLVRSLARDTRPAGEYSVFWDGTDDAGHRVSAGVYLYRLRVGPRTWVRRIVMIR